LRRPNEKFKKKAAIQNALEEDSFMDAAPPVPVKEKSGLIQNESSDTTMQDRI